MIARIYIQYVYHHLRFETRIYLPHLEQLTTIRGSIENILIQNVHDYTMHWQQESTFIVIINCGIII